MRSRLVGTMALFRVSISTMPKKKTLADGPLVPPIEFYPGSNGEVAPLPATPGQRAAYGEWRQIVEDKHKRLGLTRRQFAESACGMTAALAVLGEIGCATNGAASGNGAGGGAGSSLDAGIAGTSGGGNGGGAMDANRTEDMAAAREILNVSEFVVDVQTHPPNGMLLAPWEPKSPQQEALDYIKMTYVQSDVSVAVLTGWPSAREQNEANVKANAILKEITERLGGDRFLFHANANADLAGEPEYIEKLAAQFPNICAWKTYPQAQQSDRLHQKTAFLERVRKTGIKILAAHRGLHANQGYESPGSPEDIVRAALMFPDIKFLIYHAGYERADEENHGYVDMGAQTKGVDRLVKAVLWAKEQNGGKVPANVFADIGTTWAQIMSNNPVAVHVMGKLLHYLGPDQVLFGTDAYNGNQKPQPQILALRMFDIPTEMQEQFGYPALTPDIRRKILGGNAANVYNLDVAAIRYRIKDDDVAKLKLAYHDDPRSVPMPEPRRYRGPRNRREFLAFTAYEKKAWG